MSNNLLHQKYMARQLYKKNTSKVKISYVYFKERRLISRRCKVAQKFKKTEAMKAALFFLSSLTRRHKKKITKQVQHIKKITFSTPICTDAMDTTYAEV